MAAILSPASIDIRAIRNCRTCSTAKSCVRLLLERPLPRLTRRTPRQIAGVDVVHDGNFVGVAAPSARLLLARLAAIHAEWKSQPQISNKELFDYLKKNPVEGGGPLDSPFRYETGSVDKAFGICRSSPATDLHDQLHCACSARAAGCAGAVVGR